jgi:hypothetical protein
VTGYETAIVQLCRSKQRWGPQDWPIGRRQPSGDMRTRNDTALRRGQREHVRPLPVSPESRAHPLGVALADGQKFADAA